VVTNDVPDDSPVIGLPGRVVGDVRDRKKMRETQGE
jgi:serine acetyltransferase